MKKVTVLFLLLFLNSCVTTFKVVNSNYNNKGKRIAVISALYNEATSLYVSKFESKLEECSNYKIITQSKIKKILGKYPTKIKGPYGSALLKEKFSYKNTDRVKLIKIGKKLNVDYVYVIWLPSDVLVIDRIVNQMNVYTQMFDIASGNEIGHGEHTIDWATGNNSAEEFNAALDDWIKHTSKEMAQKTGMLKK